MKEINTVSLISVQNPDLAKDTGIHMAMIFAGKFNKTAVYIPAGCLCEREGKISLTELRYLYEKGKNFNFKSEGNPVILNPFSCILEHEEEPEEYKYFNFITNISSHFDAAFLNIGNLSPAKTLCFMENTGQTIAVFDCSFPNYKEKLQVFIRNIKMIYGEQSFIKEKIVYLILNGNMAESKKTAEIIRKFLKYDEEELSERIFCAAQSKWEQKVFIKNIKNRIFPS